MNVIVGNIFVVLLYCNPLKNITQTKYIINDAIATAMHAIRTVVTTILGNTPGALAFGKDMLLNISLVVDWKAITQACEQEVNENLRCENLKRRSYDYKQGHKVIKLIHKPTNLGCRTFGPFTIK